MHQQIDISPFVVTETAVVIRLLPTCEKTCKTERKPVKKISRCGYGEGRRATVLFALMIGTLLAGCTVGPNYSRPAVAGQAGWKEGAASINTPVLPPEWWRVFNDSELNLLEAQAVEANQDLKRAMARVAEARALTGVAEAEMYPQISAGAGYSRNRVSRHSVGAPNRDLEYGDIRSQFDLSYEVDVWGRVRRTVEAARADTAAVATDLQVVILTVTADVARNYYMARSLDAEKRIVEATIALRRDAVSLQETRNKAGLINEVDVTRARTELANVEAELYVIVRSRAQLEHALAVLCGQLTDTFSVATVSSAIATPEVPAGLPSTLLERRPDLVEAEQRLEADSARIGVAKAAFFPTITLTKTAGLASADLGSFLAGGSRFWSIGPSVHIPIFEGRRNEASLHAARARYEQSVAGYRGAVLNAFREVEDALSDLTTLSSQSEAVNRASVSSRDTASLAGERYQKGLSSYLDVVDAQRAALQAERQAIQLRAQRAVSTILLVKALGGGWSRTNAVEFARN
jgi:outer membrane protein, multidrug efflux system